METLDTQKIEFQMQNIFEKYPEAESISVDKNGKWTITLDRGTVTEQPHKSRSLIGILIFLEALPPLNT